MDAKTCYCLGAAAAQEFSGLQIKLYSLAATYWRNIELVYWRKNNKFSNYITENTYVHKFGFCSFFFILPLVCCTFHPNLLKYNYRSCFATNLGALHMLVFSIQFFFSFFLSFFCVFNFFILPPVCLCTFDPNFRNICFC